MSTVKTRPKVLGCNKGDYIKQQEWSSLKNSYENWDEIMKFSGHLVIGNGQYAIGIWDRHWVGKDLEDI